MKNQKLCILLYCFSFIVFPFSLFFKVKMFQDKWSKADQTDGRTSQEFSKCIFVTVRAKCSQILKQSNFLSLYRYGSQAQNTSKEKELILIRTPKNGHSEYLVIGLLKILRFGWLLQMPLLME